MDTTLRTSPVAPPEVRPDLLLGANATISESYVTNGAGISGRHRPDYITTLGFGVQLNKHSRRTNVDASYYFNSDFYARHTLPTQIYNNLQLVGDVDVVPEYLDVSARAFAQPVTTTNLGAVTANNRIVPDTFRNSYGYSVSPDFKLSLGDFATSRTIPSFSQVFFTTPAGSSASPLFPFNNNPQDTTMRSFLEQVTSGSEFSRLNWSLTGVLSEVARNDTLLSEKAGIATSRYAVSETFSLLLTGGYDAISNTIAFNQNLSGPVAMAGFGLTSGPNFDLQVQAGTKYNSFSFSGSLRYNLTPTVSLVGSADDYVQTPEGQLLNSLTNLTALGNGSLLSSQSVLGNGTGSSLSSYSIQSQGLSLGQYIARYQIVSLSFLKEGERSHANVTLYGSRQSVLTGVINGRSRLESGGVQAYYSYNFSPLLIGTLGTGYTQYQELGGNAHMISAEAGLNFSLSRQTQLYMRTSYRDRTSTSGLGPISSFTGNADDLRVTIGLGHSF